VLEHNGYSYSTPTARQTAVPRLALKARAYGVPATTVDGNDVLAVYEATKRAVNAARRGEGVSMIEVVTYRRKGHAEHDDQRYQPKEEIDRWAANDPIDRYAARLLGEEWARDAELAVIEERVRTELDRAVAEAESDPLPAAESALSDVFAHPADVPRLWFRESPWPK